MLSKDRIWYNTKKCVICTIGVFLTAVGIELFLLSNLGVDSVSVFVQGLQRTMQQSIDPNITYGTASLVFNCTFLLIACVVARRHIFIGTFISSLFMGNMLNAIEPIMRSWMPDPMPYAVQLTLMVIGQLVLCMAIALVVAVRFGQASANAVLFKISEITGMHFKWTRIAFEAICVVVGWVMGGVVGLGTVFCVITTGPVVSFFTKLYNRTILKAIGLDDPLNEMKTKKDVQEELLDEIDEEDESEEDEIVPVG